MPAISLVESGTGTSASLFAAVLEISRGHKLVIIGVHYVVGSEESEFHLCAAVADSTT